MPETVDVVELLKRLVACPSVSPAEGVACEPPFGERRLVEMLAALCGEWGAHVEIQDVAPGRANLVARFDGADASRSIAFEAHADTVRVDDMTIPPFEPAVRDGKVYGRGACDTKGSMAAMLVAIKRTLDERGKPPITTYFVSTCDEELGGKGAQHLARKIAKVGFAPDACVIGEPTMLDVVHANRGVLRWVVTTKGQAGHATSSGAANAIYHMRRVLACIEGPIAARLVEDPHPVLGPRSINVGTIRGGTQVNTVPSSCAIEVDRRTLPGEERDTITSDFRAALEELKAECPALDVHVRESQWYPALDEPLDSPLVRAAVAACERVLGQARTRGVPWTTNAGFLREAGVPCVVMGPGTTEQAHTVDEYLELEQLARAVDVYGAVLRAYSGGE